MRVDKLNPYTLNPFTVGNNMFCLVQTVDGAYENKIIPRAVS